MITARDGKTFSHPMQAAKYERWLDEKDRAPGGTAHDEAARLHGPAKRVTIEREGLGRHVVTSEHVDGFKHQSVHPEAFRAHQVGAALLGIEAPAAVQTHSRARAHPTGPKESDRLASEDGRRSEEEP